MQSVLSINDNHVKLLCIGSANFGKFAFSRYERKIKKLSEKNKDRIIFTGYIDNGEIYKFASLADVQCVPSLCEEAAGLVVIEAMAEGLPLIVTRSGGAMEYVDKDTASIIEKDNIVENLKRAILYMKENPQVRNRMSENARIQSKKYDEIIYYKNFMGMIFNVIDENSHNYNT